MPVNFIVSPCFNLLLQVEVVEGVAGEEDHHDEQEEHGEENAEAEGQHDEHDEDGILRRYVLYTQDYRRPV